VGKMAGLGWLAGGLASWMVDLGGPDGANTLLLLASIDN
jgi:hypothetical protein